MRRRRGEVERAGEALRPRTVTRRRDEPGTVVKETKSERGKNGGKTHSHHHREPTVGRWNPVTKRATVRRCGDARRLQGTAVAVRRGNEERRRRKKKKKKSVRENIPRKYQMQPVTRIRTIHKFKQQIKAKITIMNTGYKDKNKRKENLVLLKMNP